MNLGGGKIIVGANESSEQSRLLSMPGDHLDIKRISFAGALDKLDKNATNLNNQIIASENNEISLLIEKPLYQPHQQQYMNTADEQRHDSMEHTSAQINNEAKNTKPSMIQFAAQMGMNTLGGNQVASKIPTDFFQKPSQVTLEEASQDADLSYDPPVF